MYVKKVTPVRARPRRRGLLGFGDDGRDAHGCTPDQVWNDTAGGCVSIDENIRIINAGAAAASSGGSSSSGSSGTLNKFLSALFPPPTVATGPMVPVSSGGIGTGTAIAIAGGVVVLALLLSRR